MKYEADEEDEDVLGDLKSYYEALDEEYFVQSTAEKTGKADDREVYVALK